MEKRFKTGLVLGKFCPTTEGHRYLIDTAASQCDTLYVMMCSLVSEPIPGYLRFEWLRKIYLNVPNIKIIHCEDENPQYPYEHKHFWDIWYNSVYKRIDRLDAVFTSEEYGDPFAECLGVEHVLVDIERKVVPISATMVRNNPFKYWDFIPDVVKPYYTKKIVVVGPESTGKSTLVKQLAEHYNCPMVEEYGREYTDKFDDNFKLGMKDFENIAIGHDRNINKALGDKYLIIDTESITTYVFSLLYGVKESSKVLNGYMENQSFDLYLLMDIDIPWVDDGTRDFSDPNDRERHFNLLKSYLDVKAPVRSVSGVGSDRFNCAIKYIDDL
jgi:HTH-type transcriptional repressor of NAD biosynthesis genes